MSQFDENAELRAVTEELLSQIPMWKRPMPIMETIGLSIPDGGMAGSREFAFFLLGLRAMEAHPEWGWTFIRQYLEALHTHVGTEISSAGLDSKVDWIVELMPVSAEGVRYE